MIDLGIDDHFQKEWFHKALEAHKKGRGNIYLHGIKTLKEDFQTFYDNGLHEYPPYHTAYEPNPYEYQYDLFMHMWINFFSILRREIKLLNELGKEDVAAELEDTQRLYGISRTDCWFAAAELRWPTVMKGEARTGKAIRDPWSEGKIDDLSDEFVKYDASFGGAGQGKTTIYVAFAITVWDHYLFTEKGARSMISTTNQDKLKSVSWPYVTNLYRATEQGISNYAGRGRIAGDFTIARPQNKDTAGVFKGILLGASINESTIQDKLTGTHGHHFVCYVLDEATSTPEAPLIAANNFTQHAKDFRVPLAGNFGEDNDTLGNNITPIGGWANVDENTHKWKTYTAQGHEILVRHFNNQNSPAMTNADIARTFPHLPNQKTLNKTFPRPESRSMNNLAYRRFWVGFRSSSVDPRIVLTDNLVKENKADQKLILISPISLFSFDSAPSEIDRNPMTLGQEGLCPDTKQRIFGPTQVIPLQKTSDSLRYIRENSAEMLKIIKDHNIQSGNGIVDWTGRPGHAEYLSAAGFYCQRIVYNKAVPDGKRVCTIERRVLPAVRLNIQVSWKTDLKVPYLCAHHVAETCIDFAAWLTQTYVRAGRLRGIHEDILKAIDSKGIDKELYSRKFRYKISTQYGERFKLLTKEEFRLEFGFSPDILDTIFGLSYMAFMYRNIPLTSVENSATLDPTLDLDKEENFLNELHHLTERLEDEPISKNPKEKEVDLFVPQVEFLDGGDDYWRNI